MGAVVVCVLNVDLGLGANFFSDFCVQCNILHGTEYKSLAACVCVSVYLRVSAHGTGGRISRKWLKIWARFQLDTNRSRLWNHYAWG